MTRDVRATTRALLVTRVVRPAAVKVRRAAVRASVRVAQRAARQGVTLSEDDGADSDQVSDDAVAMDAGGVGGEGAEGGVGDEVGAVERWATQNGKLVGLVRWAGALVGGDAPVQWVPEHRLGAFWVGVGRRMVADRAGRRRRRDVLAGTKAKTLPASSGRVADAERRRGEAVERAVRLAAERASRALARASASGQMAGAKRGAAEAVDKA